MNRVASVCECGEHGFVALTKGAVTLFDPEFAQAVALWTWHAKHNRGHYYAARTEHVQVGDRRRSIVISLHSMIAPAPRSLVVDHKNGDTLDNRRSNLRMVTNSVNCINKRLQVGTSQYRGVCRTSRGWKAVIGLSGRQIYLGRHQSERDAALAYDRAALQYHGEFAKLNFPDRRQGLAA